ncbi:MAG: hypothetical protein IJT32_02295 [Lachnospiraceae bacterium]|nr:hypothetical protein [Lachnospiraceae bacterium]
MKGWKENNLKSERGAIMLEAVFGILASLFTLLFLLSFGFYLYQRSVERIIARNIVEDYAASFRYPGKTDMSTMSKADILSQNRYLYYSDNYGMYQAKGNLMLEIGKGSISATNLEQERAAAYGYKNYYTDEIGRRHYGFQMKGQYNFLLGGILRYAGLSRSGGVTSVGERSIANAEGSDILEYISMVRMTQLAEQRMEHPRNGKTDNDFVRSTDKVLTLIDRLY